MDEWYYMLDVECFHDAEGAEFGPIPLEVLLGLLRDGTINEECWVGNGDADWRYADEWEEVVRGWPLDLERIVREYCAHPYEPRDWAVRRWLNLSQEVPEVAWEVLIQMIDRSVSDDNLGCLAAGPLEDLLSLHGERFIARVEARAAENATFKRALTMVWRLGMTDDVWRRVRWLNGLTHDWPPTSDA